MKFTLSPLGPHLRGVLPRLRAGSLKSWQMGVGAVAVLVYVNVTAPSAVSVISMQEAEGPRFASTDQLDIETTFNRKRVCQAFTQRYVWRWINDDKGRVQQDIPLLGTVAPFLADTNRLITTIPNPGVPDLNDNWFYRSVTAENCPLVPEALNTAAGGAGSVTRSQDIPVTFTGEPRVAHDQTLPATN